MPCPVGIVTMQGIPSADVRPRKPWIDLLQKCDTARCFQLRLGDKLNFRFGFFPSRSSQGRRVSTAKLVV